MSCSYNTHNKLYHQKSDFEIKYPHAAELIAGMQYTLNSTVTYIFNKESIKEDIKLNLSMMGPGLLLNAIPVTHIL